MLSSLEGQKNLQLRARIDNQLRNHTDKVMEDSQTIFDFLFDHGHYEIILQKVFLLLDGPSLEACSLVCKKWRRFILKLFHRQVSKSDMTMTLTFYCEIFHG